VMSLGMEAPGKGFKVLRFQGTIPTFHSMKR
jgi:hypothetical protein